MAGTVTCQLSRTCKLRNCREAINEKGEREGEKRRGEKREGRRERRGEERRGGRQNINNMEQTQRS